MLEKEEDGKKRIYLEPSSFYLPAKGTFLCAGQFLMAINLKGTRPSSRRCAAGGFFFSITAGGTGYPSGQFLPAGEGERPAEDGEVAKGVAGVRYIILNGGDWRQPRTGCNLQNQ